MNYPLILGLYGLSKNKNNISGYEIVSNSKALEILQTAWDIGIKFIDTAPSYGEGNADILIQEARNRGLKYKLYSKVGLDIRSGIFNSNPSYLHDQIIKLNNSHKGHVHSLLLHSPPKELLEQKEFLSNFFQDVKNILGNFVNVGISLKSPKDYVLLRDFREKLIIETNLSWFDLRILKYLSSESNPNHIFLARSIFASGLIDLMCKKDYIFKNVFSANDIRSSWDLEMIIKKNKNDVDRVRKVKNIIYSGSISELSFSLFPMLSKILGGLIIGPLSIEELNNSNKNYQLFEEYIPNPNLINLLLEYNPKLNKILNY